MIIKAFSILRFIWSFFCVVTFFEAIFLDFKYIGALSLILFVNFQKICISHNLPILRFIFHFISAILSFLTGYFWYLFTLIFFPQTYFEAFHIVIGLDGQVLSRKDVNEYMQRRWHEWSNIWNFLDAILPKTETFFVNKVLINFFYPIFYYIMNGKYR